jgi:hypothetical protein
MMHHRATHLFAQFLIDKGIVDQWMHNTPEGREFKTTASSFLDDSFIWEFTHEDHDYWSDLDREWREALKKEMANDTR